MKSLTTTLSMTAVLYCSAFMIPQARAETRGFLITALAPAIYDDGEKSCPGGIVDQPDTEAILAKMPKAERQRLSRYENRMALVATACKAAATPEKPVKGQQAADKYDKDPKAAQQVSTVQGKVAYGFDLNRPHGNTRPAYYCEHENFVSPDGESGIDNQWYRVVGCLKTFRPGGDLYEYFNTAMRNGEFSLLATIDGIDNPVNDPEVKVGLYVAADPKAASKQTASAKQSLRVHPDKYYQAVARGKIVDGVITTEPVHMRFHAPRLMHELEIRDARVKLQLQPNGTFKGLLGGYLEIVHLAHWAVGHAMEAPIPTGPTICTNFNATIKTLADGYPDPKKAGPCGWISSAFQVEAVPATVLMK